MFYFNIVNSSVQNRKILVGQSEIRKVTKSLISIMYQTIYIHSIILVLKTDTVNFPQKFQVFYCFFFFYFLLLFLGGSSSDSLESCISVNLHLGSEGEGVAEIPIDLSESASPCI